MSGAIAFHAPAATRRPGGLGAFLLILPALALFLALFAFPVLRLLSLGFADFSFAWYAKALTQPLYREVFALTFRIAAATTALCLLLGYPVAYWLATTTQRRRAIGFLFILLPFWTSVLVRTYAWMVLLGRNGVVNKILLGLGVIDHPLALIYDFTGVLIGMVHVLLPYMILPLYSALRRVDPSLVQAAEGLGASGFAVFRRVYLPLTASGIAAGSILVFVLALGFFITPALLGGGHVVMIAVLIQQEVGELLDWNFAAALSGLLLVLTLAIYALVQGAVERRQRGRP
ncbi:MAG TPA: ABC transporter permease [Acetobacteraceae bacterium]|nr:ABC transporter permease [Acetobacteraceae bacterium]